MDEHYRYGCWGHTPAILFRMCFDLHQKHEGCNFTEMIYCKSRNFRWCFIFGNFGAEIFTENKTHRKCRYSTSTLTWNAGLPKISLRRTADFGEYRKYYTTENFCFYSTLSAYVEHILAYLFAYLAKPLAYYGRFP